jgi:hypothetical protein
MSLPWARKLGQVAAADRQHRQTSLRQAVDRFALKLAERADISVAAAYRVIHSLPSIVIETVTAGERCAIPGLGEWRRVRWKMSAVSNACGDLPERVLYRLMFRPMPAARKWLNGVATRRKWRR